MAKPKPTIVARFNPDPSHYVLPEVEFDHLCQIAKVPEKENFLFLLGIFIPCSINTYAKFPAEMPEMTVEFLLNFVVAVITALVALFQGRAWYSKRKAYSNFVKKLKERPEGRLSFSPSEAVFVSDKPANKL